MSLIGTLKDLSLFNLVQLHCSERQGAQVSLTHGDRVGRLVFADGELVCAGVDRLTGEEAAYELLTWDDGDFRVDYDAPPVERNIHTPWSVLLLEAMRRVDEARAERDVRLEATLRSMKGTHGLRAAVVANATGQVRAAAASASAQEDAALVAFLGARAETIGGALSGGAFREALASSPSETVWIAKKDSAYLGCWLERRTSLQPVQVLLRSLLSRTPTAQSQGAPGGPALSR